MRLPIRLIALPLALALSVGARADAVETLKTSLPNTTGFEVENSRAGQGGVTCITYKVFNDHGGKSRVHAIVDGDKAMHETPGDQHFARAWNEKCAAK